MDYLLVSDYLWSVGHILTGISIIVKEENHWLAVGLVLFGQGIIIVSRPIGRIKQVEVDTTPEIVYL